MNQALRRLVEEGLHEDNLRKLAHACGDLFAEAPAVYGSLTYMFLSFAEEYDNQGIDADRYDLILATIRGPILLLLEEEKDPAVVLHRLNTVFSAFAKLKPQPISHSYDRPRILLFQGTSAVLP